MRILVTGGRDFTDWGVIEAALAKYPGRHTLVHGDARGADTVAAAIAKSWGWELEAHPAQWDLHGKPAGFIRNVEMARLGADVCVAFPGGRGTAHMVEQVRSWEIPLVQVEAS